MKPEITVPRELYIKLVRAASLQYGEQCAGKRFMSAFSLEEIRAANKLWEESNA